MMPSHRRPSRSAGSASFDASDRGPVSHQATTPGGARLTVLAREELGTTDDLARLRSLLESSAERRRAALRDRVEADAESFERLVRRRLRGDRALSARLLRGDRNVERRLDTAFTGLAQLGPLAPPEAESRDELWQSALLLSALPLFAFYGRRHLNHRLTLLGILMIFLLGDKITDLLSGADERREYGKLWSYVAPAANLLAGWWLLHDRQLEQFVSGVAQEFEVVGPRSRRDPEELGLRGKLSVAGFALEGAIRVRDDDARRSRRSIVERYVAVVDLTPEVAADLALDLPTLDDLPVVATLLDSEWSVDASWRPRVVAVSARVTGGSLRLTVTARAEARGPGARRRLLKTLRVAWLVDVSESCRPPVRRGAP